VAFLPNHSQFADLVGSTAKDVDFAESLAINTMEILLRKKIELVYDFL
jgi:hypothetical protein